jgi:hypothetical protein
MGGRVLDTYVNQVLTMEPSEKSIREDPAVGASVRDFGNLSGMRGIARTSKISRIENAQTNGSTIDETSAIRSHEPSIFERDL